MENRTGEQCDDHDEFYLWARFAALFQDDSDSDSDSDYYTSESDDHSAGEQEESQLGGRALDGHENFAQNFEECEINVSSENKTKDEEIKMTNVDAKNAMSTGRIEGRLAPPMLRDNNYQKPWNAGNQKPDSYQKSEDSDPQSDKESSDSEWLPSARTSLNPQTERDNIYSSEPPGVTSAKEMVSSSKKKESKKGPKGASGKKRNMKEESKRLSTKSKTKSHVLQTGPGRSNAKSVKRFKEHSFRSDSALQITSIQGGSNMNVANASSSHTKNLKPVQQEANSTDLMIFKKPAKGISSEEKKKHSTTRTKYFKRIQNLFKTADESISMYAYFITSKGPLSNELAIKLSDKLKGNFRVIADQVSYNSCTRMKEILCNMVKHGAKVKIPKEAGYCMHAKAIVFDEA